MNRTRYLVAASLACVLTGSGVYIHLMRPPLRFAAPVEQKVASNDVAPAPSTVQAKKESDGEASLRTHIPRVTDAAKPDREAATPAIVAVPPPPLAKPELHDQIAGLLPAPAAPSSSARSAAAPKTRALSPPSGRIASREPSPTRALPSASAPRVALAEVARGDAPREHAPSASEPVGRDQFANAPENAFKIARDAPVSTFSIDVDTASYSFVRAQLNR
ncbi:MAG: von Willebrand factor type A domain-containing protein, partial [Bradyrhizobium sp.]